VTSPSNLSIRIERPLQAVFPFLSQACRPYATPSSISFFDRHPNDVRIAKDESVKSRSANKSAEVVLGPGDKRRRGQRTLLTQPRR